MNDLTEPTTLLDPEPATCISRLCSAAAVLCLAVGLIACTPPDDAGTSGGPGADSATATTSNVSSTEGSAVSITANESAQETLAATQTLTIMVHDSFNVSDAVVKRFETLNNVKVRFLKSGDAGESLSKAILAKDAPLADALYGIDNTFLSRALKEDVFEAYDTRALAQIPAEFVLDPEHRALPVDYGDVCLNYDKAALAAKGIDPPAGLEDLTKPAYKDLLVVENPATSSPGLAFLLATISHFGEDGYLNYWRALKANGVQVVNDWESAYNREFSGSAGKGPRPIVVSYGSSPPFEVIFATTTPAEAPTAAVVSDGSCFRQIEFVGILKGTAKRRLAEAWVDFMLSLTFQEDLPLQMYVFPVHPAAELDPRFKKFMSVPKVTAQVAPEAIATNRETWIEDWTDAVLR